MNCQLKLIVTIFLAQALMFLSCKKELSCEGCKEGNKPPIANAGADQTITLPKDSSMLDGTASTDPDGTITSYKWAKIAGPVSAIIVKVDSSKTVVRNLVAGVYRFELTVTDNGGLSAKDTVLVMVDAPGNQPPIACVGPDQTITLPTNSVTLDGSCSADPNNNITSYVWTKIAGSSANIVTLNAIQTQVTGLMQGVYLFELKVNDAGGLSSKDTIKITVNAGVSYTCGDSNRPQITAKLIPVGKLSQPRCGMAVASAGNKIVFAGAALRGSQSGFIYGSSRVDIYDVIAQTWSTAELSETRSDIAAIAAGNKLFFGGGRLGDGAFDLLFSTVDIYDASTNQWSVASLSEQRAYVAAATVGNKVFFAGGEKDWNYNGSDRVDIYDLSSNTWSTSHLSKARKGINAVTVIDKIYFAGGAGQWQWHNEVYDRIDVYDNTTNTWSVGTLNQPKAFFAGIAQGYMAYWGGGVDGSSIPGASCKVEIRNTVAQTSSIAFLHKPTVWWTNGGDRAVLKDNKIVFFSVSSDTDKFDIYDISTGGFSVGVLPFKLELAAIINVNNTIYVAGGMIAGVLSDQVWKLEF